MLFSAEEWCEREFGLEHSFLLGIGALVVPVVSGFYMRGIEPWTLFDWLVMYSYVY